MKRGALLILVNEQGKLLLQHKDSRAPVHANKWCLFGGGIEKGEDPSEAIRREFTEELEWHIKKFSHFKSYPTHEVFVAKTRKPAAELRSTLHEGNDVQYFSPSDLSSIDIAGPHKEIIDEYLRGKPTHVLFICRGNAFRSIIAEAYLKSLGLKNVTVHSAGSLATLNRAANAVRFKEIRALLERHGLKKFAKLQSAEQLTQPIINQTDIAVCMNTNIFNGCKQTFTLPSETLIWHITDIGEGDRIPKNSAELHKFEEATFRQIIREVDALVDSHHFVVDDNRS